MTLKGCSQILEHNYNRLILRIREWLRNCLVLPQAWSRTLAMEEDYKRPPPYYDEVITEQHTSNTSQSRSADNSKGSCCKCCISTKNCLMSPECGRALNIASVVAMCGMCIRMFVCEYPEWLISMTLHHHSKVWGLKTNKNLLFNKDTLKLLKVAVNTFQNVANVLGNTLFKGVLVMYVTCTCYNSNKLCIITCK